ncbi:MAG: glycosyltransferase family 4 protein, partial [Pirellulaceae bacterium]
SVYSAPPPSSDKGGKLTRYYARLSCQHADVCIAMSAHTAAEWTSYLDIEEGRFEVVYNGVDAALFRQADGSRLREQLGIPPTAVVIGMTGRMEPEKGPLVLARAAAQLAAEFPNVYWLFVGAGSQEQSLRALLHDTGLSQRARVLGFRSDIPELTAAYDIAMVPSLFQEPFGLVVAEAMAAGKPVVASRVGGIPEIVTDGDTGVLVPAGDPAEIARAVALLLRSPDKQRQMGFAGQRRVEQLFTRSRMIGHYLRIYEQLLET